MPEISKEDAGRVADRVCQAIADLEVSASHPNRGVTMSIGVASYPGDALESEALIRCADRAMYTAKAKGKNQAQIYGANRRALRRVQVEVEGEIRVLDAQSLPFSTLDISERGLRFRAKTSLEMNSMVEFVLKLPGHRQGVKAYGRIVRAYAAEDGFYEMAIEIMDIDTREFLALSRYLNKQAAKPSGESEPV